MAGKKQNPFEKDLKNTAEQKDIPYTSKQLTANEKYKTIRIRPEDYKKLKEYAFFNDMNMVDAVGIAINLLEENK